MQEEEGSRTGILIVENGRHISLISYLSHLGYRTLSLTGARSHREKSLSQLVWITDITPPSEYVCKLLTKGVDIVITSPPVNLDGIWEPDHSSSPPCGAVLVNANTLKKYPLSSGFGGSVFVYSDSEENPLIIKDQHQLFGLQRHQVVPIGAKDYRNVGDLTNVLAFAVHRDLETIPNGLVGLHVFTMVSQPRGKEFDYAMICGRVVQVGAEALRNDSQVFFRKTYFSREITLVLEGNNNPEFDGITKKVSSAKLNTSAQGCRYFIREYDGTFNIVGRWYSFAAFTSMKLARIPYEE